LDALLTCHVALAFHLPQSFFNAARLGKPVSRQLGVELAEIMGNGESWTEIPFRSFVGLRDNVRNYLLDPYFTYSRIDVNEKTEFDSLDPYLVPYDLIDWSVVRRSVCSSCGHSETNGTFAKDMRGLHLNMKPEKWNTYRSVQEVVDEMVFLLCDFL